MVTSKKREKRGRQRKTRSEAGEWKDVFLSVLSKMPVVRVACERSGVSRKTVYQWRERDAEFAKAWDEAREDGIDRIEEHVMAQALNDNITAGIFLLKSLRRNTYGERLYHSGPGGQSNPVRIYLPENCR